MLGFMRVDGLCGISFSRLDSLEEAVVLDLRRQGVLRRLGNHVDCITVMRPNAIIAQFIDLEHGMQGCGRGCIFAIPQLSFNLLLNPLDQGL